jgi:NET1-associated nuclear protein 1 (U3 small nucleolar RNA-associated protein 17)
MRSNRTQHRHIILATEDEAQVFAISTSRLVRTLSINDAGRLTALKLSHGNSLFVSSYSGSLVQWDWETGAEVQTYKISRSTIAFDIAAADEPAPHERELLFAIGAPAAGKREISLNVLSAKGGCHTSVVLDTAAPISDLKVLDGGRTVLTWAGDSLLVGYLAERDPGSLDDPVIYTWREVRLPGQVTCLDVRVIPGHESGFLRVDVVLGQSTGPILICNDILNRLLRCETGESDNNLVSSRLHWHRKAVNAVKWSKDGKCITLRHALTTKY